MEQQNKNGVIFMRIDEYICFLIYEDLIFIISKDQSNLAKLLSKLASEKKENLKKWSLIFRKYLFSFGF